MGKVYDQPQSSQLMWQNVDAIFEISENVIYLALQV